MTAGRAEVVSLGQQAPVPNGRPINGLTVRVNRLTIDGSVGLQESQEGYHWAAHRIRDTCSEAQRPS
jgi:hypothetical protein